MPTQHFFYIWLSALWRWLPPCLMAGLLPGLMLLMVPGLLPENRLIPAAWLVMLLVIQALLLSATLTWLQLRLSSMASHVPADSARVVLAPEVGIVDVFDRRVHAFVGWQEAWGTTAGRMVYARGRGALPWGLSLGGRLYAIDSAWAHTALHVVGGSIHVEERLAGWSWGGLSAWLRLRAETPLPSAFGYVSAPVTSAVTTGEAGVSASF